MRLLITHHAFVRLGDWHPEYRGLIPTGKVTLNLEQASRMLTALGVLVFSLEQARAATLLESVTRKTERRYNGRRSLYLFDRESGDFFQMVRKDPATVAILTVTWLSNEGQRDQVLDDHRQEFRFSEVKEIAVPYHLNEEAQSLKEADAVITPSGRIIPIAYGQTSGVKENADV